MLCPQRRHAHHPFANAHASVPSVKVSSRGKRTGWRLGSNRNFSRCCGVWPVAGVGVEDGIGRAAGPGVPSERVISAICKNTRIRVGSFTDHDVS